jgi:hypothetical protein
MDFLISYSNSLGLDTHIIELVDNGKPDPPKSLVVKQMDYKTVRLKVRETSSVGIVNYKDALRILVATTLYCIQYSTIQFSLQQAGVKLRCTVCFRNSA